MQHAMALRDCPLCLGKDSSTYMKKDAWNNRDSVELRKCGKCKFVFSAIANFDYRPFVCSDTYETKSRDELLSLARQDHVCALIDEIIAKSRLNGGTAVDVGCGMGLATLCLQNRGFSTYGGEESQVYLRRHKQLNIVSSEN